MMFVGTERFAIMDRFYDSFHDTTKQSSTTNFQIVGIVSANDDSVYLITESDVQNQFEAFSTLQIMISSGGCITLSWRLILLSLGILILCPACGPKNIVKSIRAVCSLSSKGCLRPLLVSPESFAVIVCGKVCDERTGFFVDLRGVTENQFALAFNSGIDRIDRRA